MPTPTSGQHGCAFCYCQERRCSTYEDLEDLTHVIKVKENAPARLELALQRVAVDLVFAGVHERQHRPEAVWHVG